MSQDARVRAELSPWFWRSEICMKRGEEKSSSEICSCKGIFFDAGLDNHWGTARARGPLDKQLVRTTAFRRQDRPLTTTPGHLHTPLPSSSRRIKARGGVHVQCYLIMSSAAPPDAISASSAGTGNKKKNKNKKKPKKAVDTGGDHGGAADQQQPSPNPRDGNSNEVSAAEDEPDTPAVSPATVQEESPADPPPRCGHDFASFVHVPCTSHVLPTAITCYGAVLLPRRRIPWDRLQSCRISRRRCDRPSLTCHHRRPKAGTPRSRILHLGQIRMHPRQTVMQHRRQETATQSPATRPLRTPIQMTPAQS